jgi:hypothetical protein
VKQIHAPKRKKAHTASWALDVIKRTSANLSSSPTNHKRGGHRDLFCLYRFVSNESKTKGQNKEAKVDRIDVRMEM